MNLQHDLSIYYLPARDLRSDFTRNSKAEAKKEKLTSRNCKFIISKLIIFFYSNKKREKSPRAFKETFAYSSRADCRNYSLRQTFTVVSLKEARFVNIVVQVVNILLMPTAKILMADATYAAGEIIISMLLLHYTHSKACVYLAIYSRD